MSNKQKRYHIYVNYFIQNDSWESISHPNLFVLPQEFTNLNDVKAQMVYDNFPLNNKQNFYLRFFLDDKTQGVKGWVDFPPNAIIPIYNDGHVYVKVLRLPKEVKINFKNQEMHKPKPTQAPKISKDNSPNLIFMDDNKNQQSSSSVPPKNDNSAFNQDLFSDLNKDMGGLGNMNPNMNPNMNSNMGSNMNSNMNSNGAQIPPMKPQKPIDLENNMNNVNNTSNTNQNNQNAINLEDWGAFTGNNGSVGGFNMDNANQGSSNDLNNVDVDPNLLNVFSNISSSSLPKEEAPGYDFTANMKKGGSIYPIDNISEDLPEDEIKDKVDAIINQWSLGGEGKKNLLFLLTTLHEVWKYTDISIPDMQTLVNDKSKVRTYYKKAMRDLHADKNRDKKFKTKYIASCLYQLLNEANSNY